MTNHNFTITIDPAQGSHHNDILGAFCNNGYTFNNLSRLNCSGSPDESGTIACASGDTLTVQINFNQANLDLSTGSNTYISAFYLNSMYAFLFVNPDNTSAPTPESVGLSTDLGVVFSSANQNFGGAFGSTLQLYSLPGAAGATSIHTGLSLDIGGTTDVCQLSLATAATLDYQLHVTGDLLVECQENQGGKYVTRYYWLGFACDPKLSISPD